MLGSAEMLRVEQEPLCPQRHLQPKETFYSSCFYTKFQKVFIANDRCYIAQLEAFQGCAMSHWSSCFSLMAAASKLPAQFCARSRCPHSQYKALYGGNLPSGAGME